MRWRPNNASATNASSQVAPNGPAPVVASLTMCCNSSPACRSREISGRPRRCPQQKAGKPFRPAASALPAAGSSRLAPMLAASALMSSRISQKWIHLSRYLPSAFNTPDEVAVNKHKRLYRVYKRSKPKFLNITPPLATRQGTNIRGIIYLRLHTYHYSQPFYPIWS
jgi:hypothetical protein